MLKVNPFQLTGLQSSPNPFAMGKVGGYVPGTMLRGFVQQIDAAPGLNPHPVMGLGQTHSTQPPNFRNVLMNTLGSVNEVAQKPDALLKDAMTTGSTDIHEVMIANTKAELAVSLAGQTVTKVIQAYDRILQIQI
jgi:flagellar hook-basal body complex protein FliE